MKKNDRPAALPLRQVCSVLAEGEICASVDRRRTRALRWWSVMAGCLDEAPFVCYGMSYSVECEYRQLWSV